jgi:uncharacterized protein involved in exopolysaccharide biosynthesis
MATHTTPEVRTPLYAPLQSVSLHDDDVAFGAVASFSRRHRRVLLATLVSGIVISVAVAFLLPRTYTARGSFVPQQGRAQMSALASLAAQFGVAVPVTDATRSPAFYVTLLDSKNLLSHVVEDSFPTKATAAVVPRSLEDYLSARGRTSGERRESAIKKLKRRLAVSVDQKAGLVAIEVQLRDADIARDVVRALLSQIDSFNLRTRQTQAISERKFTEGRLQGARAELRQAEDELLAFLQSNRDFRGSPHLTFLYDRLGRNVSLKQQLYTTLSQAYEQARIEEVRDTPVITVVEDPLLPARPDPVPLTRALIAGLFLSIAAAVIIGRRRDAAAPLRRELP